MEKLYYENSYVKDFTAEIVNVIEEDNKYHIELDKTCFYPDGGEQPYDTGFINSSPVTYVYEKEGKIYHVTDAKPLKIHRVKCSIDWKRRFDYMQQHIAQHIISACISELLNINITSAHLGENSSYIDIDKSIESAQIKDVERRSNEIILNNIPLEILYPTNAEVKKLLGKKNSVKSNERIRLIRIEDILVTPCYGIHPNSTIEIQAIKIIKWTKKGTGTRIEFISGSRIISDYFLKYELIEKISSILSCSSDALLNEAKSFRENLNKVLAENGKLKTEIAEYEVQSLLNSCENINNIRIVKSIYDSIDLKHATLLASKLTAFPNVVVLFAIKSEDKSNLHFSRSNDLNILSMNSLLKDAITLVDGKGGGNDFSAQGGGKNNNNLESAIQYAYNKVKDSILANFKL